MTGLCRFLKKSSKRYFFKESLNLMQRAIGIENLKNNGSILIRIEKELSVGTVITEMENTIEHN